MRFRAQIVDFMLLSQLCRCVGKVKKMATMMITPTVLMMTVPVETSTSLAVWCEVPTSRLFEEFIIDGVTEDKRIGWILNVRLLEKAIQNVKAAPQLTFRLMKNGGIPMLRLTAAPNGNATQQDIQVTILRPTKLLEVAPPIITDPEIQISLPELKALYSVVERLRNLTNMSVTMHGFSSRALALQVRGVSASATVWYQKLDLLFTDKITPSSVPDHTAVSVNIANLRKALQSFTVSPTSQYLLLKKNSYAVIAVSAPDVYLSYLIPHTALE